MELDSSNDRKRKRDVSEAPDVNEEASNSEPEAPTTMGADGRYRARPLPVLARQIEEPFSAERSAGGDMLHGKAGDWLLQYGPGDFGVAEQARFARIYRKLD